MDSLFGSETRAGVLEQLATTPRPQSAYRIARSIGAQPIQVLKVLKQLSGLTERTTAGWVLSDNLLRNFLRARSDAEAQRIRREKDEILVRLGARPSWEYERARVRQSHRTRP